MPPRDSLLSEHPSSHANGDVSHNSDNGTDDNHTNGSLRRQAQQQQQPPYEDGATMRTDQSHRKNSLGEESTASSSLLSDTVPPAAAVVSEGDIMMQPSLAKQTWTTYHWEMNAYCAVVIGLWYWYGTPPQHRIVWHILGALLLLDATRYYYRRGSMAGVPYTLPFVNLLAMLINPERFWAELGIIAMASDDGFCANTMVGNQLVFVTQPATCKKVFVDEEHFGLYAHPNAIWLFDPKNLIYLQGSVHKKVRAVLTPALFSEAALALYAQAQEKVCRQALQEFVQEYRETGQPLNGIMAFRSLGAKSSQEAFLGPYLTDEMRVVLEQDILTFTMGFLSFPFPYWMGGLYQAIQAKKRVEQMVFDLVPHARQRMVEQHQPPQCLLDHWCLAIAQAAQERQCKITQVHGCTDDDIARCMLDFLFAAQDATNSGLTYGLDVLHAYPHVFEKCQAEVWQHCGKPKHNGNINNDSSTTKRLGIAAAELPYIGKVANQLLHFKPPVPMVPHLCRKTVELNGHVIAKGTVVIPSVTYSARVSGHARHFDPDSTLTTNNANADTQFLQTYTFGAGQHKCPGRRYAESLLKVFIGVVAQEYTIHRIGPRPGPDDFIFYPTLFPKDSNFILHPVVVDNDNDDDDDDDDTNDNVKKMKDSNRDETTTTTSK